MINGQYWDVQVCSQTKMSEARDNHHGCVILTANERGWPLTFLPGRGGFRWQGGGGAAEKDWRLRKDWSPQWEGVEGEGVHIFVL